MKNIISTFEKHSHGVFQISIARELRACFCAVMAIAFLLASPLARSAYTVDTTASPSALTGLWWNQNESGWGASITQQYDVIFVAMYVYDGAGNPIWYVASNCAVSGSGCQGSLYKVTGGAMPTTTWNGTNPATSVGTITLAFTDNNTGTMTYILNNVNGSKAITRQVWRTAPPVVTPPTGSFPFDFKGVRLNSMTFSTESQYCKATLSLTNTSAAAVSPILYFDVIVGGVTTGQTGFVTSGLAPGATAAVTNTVLSSSSRAACGTFTLEFNSYNSSVY